MDSEKRPILTENSYVANDVVETPVQYSVGRVFIPNRSWSKKVGIAVCVLVISAAIFTFSFTFKKTTYYPKVKVVAKTECGLVEGKVEYIGRQSGIVFKGIPYAMPPIKDLRWKPPNPLKRNNGCWKGVLHANEFKSQCSQIDFTNGLKERGSEDCLYLNVWTPRLNSPVKMPVMVWIHGGSLTTGSGNEPGYSPNVEFVSTMNIVAVSMNYRLNAFGFLSLDILSSQSKSKTSGNYGFMDQILALQWVKNNIANFGGDPNQVTIVGQSSGGTSIFALLASQQANGLFQRAIAMSGSAVCNKTAKQASVDNMVFLQKSDCLKHTTDESLECIYNLNTTQVLHSIPWFEYPNWAMADQFDLPTINLFDGALCVVDGNVVKYAPSQLSAYPPMPYSVDVMVGTTAQEIDIFPAKNFADKTFDDFVKFLTKRLGPFSPKLPDRAISIYKAMLDSTTPQLLYTTMASDIRARCPSDVLSANLSLAENLSVYRYIVANRPSSPATFNPGYSSQYSAHTWDSCALFGFHGLPLNFAPNYRDNLFRETIRRELITFFRTGRPSMQNWGQYPYYTGVFGKYAVSAEKYYREEGCKLWKEFDLLSYSWVN